MSSEVGEANNAPQPIRMREGVRIVHITAVGITLKNFMCEYLLGLQKEGFDVIVVCSEDEDARYAVGGTGVRFCPVPIKRGLAPLSDLVSLYRVWWLLRRLRPHLVHVHMTKAGPVSLIAARMAGVPIRIYQNHGLAMVAFGGVKHLLLKATEWVSNRLATHVLFCGQSTLQAAVDAGVASAQKSRVLGKGTISGVDIEEFSPDESGQLRAKQRRAWNVDDTQIVVGFVGRHILHKGVATLMEAWRSLDDEVRAGAKLLLFGGAVRGEEATQKIVDAAVADDIGVKDIGWIEDMVSAYSGMDILVLPSWREGFPYAILEAQAMRLPVVTTRVTGTLDAVEHEVTGLMVPLRDPAALADAMSRLIRSPEDRKLFGERGRERVLNEFTREKVLQHVVDFYDTVLASSLSG